MPELIIVFYESEFLDGYIC